MSAEWLRAVAHSWSTLNGTLFRGAMRPPAFAMGSGGRRVGAWVRASRTILVGPMLRERAWPVVVEVLKHEMAHQYVDEVLEVHDEAPHGKAFARVCADIGADPRAVGIPVSDIEPRAVQKVRKLLALAESSNPHEAQAAARAAHKWMRQHNIEVLDAPATFGTRVVGRAAARHQAWEKALAGLLAQHFFVHAVWVPAWLGADRWGKQLELSGRPENLDLAEHVHALVGGVAERSFRAHARATGAPGRSRGRFLAGVVLGFGEQLEGQAAECEQTGLVWSGDPRLDAWLDRRYPRLRSGRRVSIPADQAFRTGREEGRKLLWKRPIRSSAASGRLLEG